MSKLMNVFGSAISDIYLPILSSTLNPSSVFVINPSSIRFAKISPFAFDPAVAKGDIAEIRVFVTFSNALSSSELNVRSGSSLGTHADLGVLFVSSTATVLYSL